MLAFTYLILAVLVIACMSYEAADTSITDKIAGSSLLKQALYSFGDTKPKIKGSNPGCSADKIYKRKEWSQIPLDDRIAYISAVQCLLSLPSRLQSTSIPGARNRYDDFVGVHVNSTLFIHGTANFLSWHRYFTWAFEQALRNECAYAGYQPYWNWAKSIHDPASSPYLDGSDTSLSGNGLYSGHPAINALPSGLNPIPAGAGGGCLASGPFANMSANLGPVAPTLPNVTAQAMPGLAFNPRCIRRDITNFTSVRFLKDTDIADLVLQSADILAFQDTMQGRFDEGFYGVHTAGHFVYAGDPSGDLFASPGDPMFWLHHAQIDRTWWMWQNLDPVSRTRVVAGNVVFGDPGSAVGTLDDLVSLPGLTAEGERSIGELGDTVGGEPFCYVYE